MTYTLPPSLPHSPKRRELVKDARRQHADRVAVQVEGPGNETRRQSALTHSTSTCPLCPSACTCMFPINVRHAHASVHRCALSLWTCAHRACLCACACASCHEHKTNVMHVHRAWALYTCICIYIQVYTCMCVCACVCIRVQKMAGHCPE